MLWYEKVTFQAFRLSAAIECLFWILGESLDLFFCSKCACFVLLYFFGKAIIYSATLKRLFLFKPGFFNFRYIN